MKNSFLFFALSSVVCINAQDSCFTAMPVCTGTLYDYDSASGVAAPVGPDYGCLGSVANPIWFSIEVGVPGNITISGSGLDFSSPAQPIDIDYIYWGPFSSLSGVCYSQLTASNIVGCDYSTSNLINVTIPAAVSGDFYIGMISNYSNNAGNIQYQQTAGPGNTPCGSDCSFAGLTAVPSSCDSSNNTYSVSGVLSFYNAPPTGTLTLFGSCGGSQTFNAPFLSPVNYSLSGLYSNGSSCFVAAGFSDDGNCGVNKMYVAPPVCNPLGINAAGSIGNFTVSPNPTNGVIDVNFTSSLSRISVCISDVLGRPVYNEELLKFTGAYKKQIDLYSFDKGIYFVKIISDKGSVTKKIIYN